MIRCGIASTLLVVRSSNPRLTPRLIAGVKKSPPRQRYTSSSSSSNKKKRSINFFESPLGWYSHKLDTHPIPTKCISAGLISGAGNLLAQVMLHDDNDDDTASGKKKFQIDWNQTGRFALLNVAFVAPVLHYWYTYIDRVVPGTAIRPVLKRVFLDEFVFTPVYVPVVLGLMWTLEGVDLYKLPRMISEEWLNVMIFDWLVYIPVQFLNFRYVPVKYQVLIINLVGVGWNCFICWRAGTQQHKEQQQQEKEKAATTT